MGFIQCCAMKSIYMVSVNGEFPEGSLASLLIALYHEIGVISVHEPDVCHQLGMLGHSNITTQRTNQ